MKTNEEFYSCACGFQTDSLSDLRRHFITAGKKEPGKHKSLRTKGRTKVVAHEAEGVTGRIDEVEVKPLHLPETVLPTVETLAEQPAGEASPTPIQVQRGGDGSYRSLIPEEVVGRGIPFKITLSVRTIAYYQIASTINPSLTLGDFIDHCVHDTFEGRGLSLGLVKIGD
jgi:hypothetical protein